MLGSWSKLSELTTRPLALTMVVTSGVAGGLSWIFAFRALRLADVSQVAPIDKLPMPLGVLIAVILLGERPTIVNWVGILLIAAGAFLATRPRPALPLATRPIETRPVVPNASQAAPPGTDPIR